MSAIQKLINTVDQEAKYDAVMNLHSGRQCGQTSSILYGRLTSGLALIYLKMLEIGLTEAQAKEQLENIVLMDDAKQGTIH